MRGETRAELFIRTLGELLEAERDMRRIQRLRQHRANARRYLQAFPAGSDEIWMPPEWSRGDNGSGRRIPAQLQAE